MCGPLHSPHNVECRQRRSWWPFATKHDLETFGEIIMSAISEFAGKQTVFQDRMDTAVTDLQGDVKNLRDQIAALQASSGAITPADQALLDSVQARAGIIADKLDALDLLTPPVVPTTP
jgi:hypothetical protein